jgi:fluoride exporter
MEPGIGPLILYVAGGGAVGSVARFALSGAVQRIAGTPIPLGTLAVNVIGSFLVGLVMRLSLNGAPLSMNVRALLAVGFCGGFTTFSTFSYETIALFEQGDVRRGTLYVVLSTALSLAGVLAGMTLARKLS